MEAGNVLRGHDGKYWLITSVDFHTHLIQFEVFDTRQEMAQFIARLH